MPDTRPSSGRAEAPSAQAPSTGPSTASSFCGKGALLLHNTENDTLIAVPLRCHRWDCDTCGPIRLLEARAKAAAGKPERLITLTTRPSPDLPLEEAVAWIRRKWRALLERIRRNFPRIEYMAFLELHKSRWPHLHILTRGSYIPQRMLSLWWKQLTGSHRVDIRHVRHTWHGVEEATKYYLKTARQVHTAAPHMPVYSMSKGWILRSQANSQRPPGPYTFYAFCVLPWLDVEYLVDTLGGSLTPWPHDPRRFTVDFRAPPDPKYVRAIVESGTFAEATLVTALDCFFTHHEDRYTHLNEQLELLRMHEFEPSH